MGVFMGHGSPHPANACYTALNIKLKACLIKPTGYKLAGGKTDKG